jgi:iron complex transport system ATP-binding protein
LNTAPTLQLEDIWFSYGRSHVLNGIDLQVAPGEMVGLVGPNGTGKSTLLNIASRTLNPQRGRVLLGGVDVQQLSPRKRASKVSMVPQSPAVPTGFNCMEVVLMGRNPHLGLLQWERPRDLEIVRHAMELTGTDEFASRPISSLSGGERQRVFIARALSQGAPLLLLDEPTAHLDIGYQPAVLDLIQKVRTEMGVSVLAAMHDISLAAQYCQRIAVLHGGSVYALGTPEEVVTADVVSRAFGAEVAISRHPVHGTPVVLPIGKNARTIDCPLASTSDLC